MTSLTLLPPGELDSAMNDRNLNVEALSQEDFAFIAYYAKYVRREIQTAITKRLRTTDIQRILESYPADVRRKIFENLGALQLTYGCNVGCDFCGFDAIHGARKHIPFETIEWMIDEYGREIKENDTFFYYASEGPDYTAVRSSGNKADYDDVLQLCTEKLDWHPFTGTTAKERHHPVLRKMIDNKHSFLVSVTSEEESIAVPDDIRLSKLHVGLNRNIKTVPLGTSALRQGQIADEGIGCFDGTLITPAGVYSVIQCQNIEQWATAPQRQFVIPFAGTHENIDLMHADVRTILGAEIPAYNPIYQGISFTDPLYNQSGIYAFGVEPKSSGLTIVTARNSITTNAYSPDDLTNFYNLYSIDEKMIYERHDRTEIRYCRPVVALTRSARLLSLLDPRNPPTQHPSEELRVYIHAYITNENLEDEIMDDVYEKLCSEPEWTLEYIRQWQEKFGLTTIDWCPLKLRANRTSASRTHESS